jgi:hypothetical protein
MSHGLGRHVALDRDHEILVPLVTLRERSCSLDGYPLNWSTDGLLMRKVPNSG